MLKRLGTWFTGALVAISVLACTREDPELNRRLARIEKGIEELKTTCASGGGRAAAGPPRPDPNTVYSVAVDPSSDPIWGPGTAKVTIVGAADFA